MASRRSTHPLGKSSPSNCSAEKINASYVGRVLRMTLLAPEIVEAILAGRQSEEVTLAGMMAGVPVVWDAQMPAGHRSGSD